ncbi:CopD family protein [Trinickia fusca]|uniref:Copper resistance protein CopD n=1 Tax=Trinickia fusca TaxID=2419777 RepID=A0A494XNK3_9BURK|nr:CopD family protein [Trinickia fusca]RKP49123.1 copper resistance protein CopD [Trinickia fusca]
MNLDGLSIGQVALAALMDVAFAFALGSALLEGWLARDGAGMRSAPSHAAWHRARGSLVAAAFALVLADAGWFFYQAASMSGTGLVAAIGVVPTAIAKTHVGHAWCAAFAGSVLLLLAALSHRGGRVGRIAFWLAALVVAASKASLGHAADAGAWSAAVGIHALHVLATGVWGGIVLAGGFVVLPALDGSPARGALIRLASRVSQASLVALGVVVLTGSLNAERGLGGSVASLQSSAWGHLLTLKLALVLLAVVLGGLNRISALPRLRRTAATTDAHTFNNVLHLEALAMVAIFIAAAVLAHTAPAA